MMGYGWGMEPWAWIFMGLFWVLLVGLIIWAITRLLPTSGAAPRTGREAPEEILDRRFALGEIDAETYRKARAELDAARGERPGRG
jgi:putative membrane protein